MMNNLADRIESLPQDQRAELVRRIQGNAAEYSLFPLSYAQGRMWFLDQVTPGQANYNMPAEVVFRGGLDVEALQSTLDGVVRRHEALRTAFVSIDGTPMQAVLPASRYASPRRPVGIRACRPAEEHRRLRLEEARRPFDLGSGRLFRSTLLKLAEDQHVLLMTTHHIVFDGWSLGVLAREISAGYRQRLGTGELLELPVQYVDFACWQREHLQGERLEALLEHWRDPSGRPPTLLTLPLDRPRPGRAGVQRGAARLRDPAAPGEALDRLARSTGPARSWCSWPSSRCSCTAIAGRPISW